MSFNDLWTPYNSPADSSGSDLLNQIENDPVVYQKLLNTLRRDLQIDASTDLATGSLLQALIDPKSGASPFVQFPAGTRLRVKVGDTGNLAAPAWANGTWASWAVAHGVSVVPSWAGAVVVNEGGSIGTGAQGSVSVSYMDATNLTIVAFNNSGLSLTSGTIAFRWAILY